jgi:hypothetical protein
MSQAAAPFANPFDAVSGLRIELPEGAELPRWTLVRRARRATQPVDIPARVDKGLRDVAAAVPGGLRGRRVAVAAGSRGITDVACVVRATVRALRDLGADPFVVPAMGSHGSSDASGQAEVLGDLGISEQTVEAPVRATMETAVVGVTATGMPVHLDRHVAESDGVVVVNRVKPHTDFTGDFGSGLAKMAVIGLGNAAGAALVHAAGSAELPRRIREGVDVLRESGLLLGGVAIVEDGTTTAHVQVVPGSGIGGPAEGALLDRAQDLHGHLPFDQIDVLVVDAMGKDISGSGMDTNVIGRFWIPGVEEPPGPRIDVVTVHDLTHPSHGNASGIGLADLVPFRILQTIDLEATYLNAITSGTGGLRRSRIPMALPTDGDVVHAAVTMSAQPDPARARIVRIRSTLHTDEILVSEPLMAQVRADASLETVGAPLPVSFGARGELPPWPSS